MATQCAREANRNKNRIDLSVISELRHLRLAMKRLQKMRKETSRLVKENFSSFASKELMQALGRTGVLLSCFHFYPARRTIFVLANGRIFVRKTLN